MCEWANVPMHSDFSSDFMYSFLFAAIDLKNAFSNGPIPYLIGIYWVYSAPKIKTVPYKSIHSGAYFHRYR